LVHGVVDNGGGCASTVVIGRGVLVLAENFDGRKSFCDVVDFNKVKLILMCTKYLSTPVLNRIRSFSFSDKFENPSTHSSQDLMEILETILQS
jgi:hypothetical protein